MNALDTTNWYKPVEDATGLIDLMKYTNNGLSYGVRTGLNWRCGSDKRYYLCDSPVLSAEINHIISEHDTPEEATTSVF